MFLILQQAEKLRFHKCGRHQGNRFSLRFGAYSGSAQAHPSPTIKREKLSFGMAFSFLPQFIPLINKGILRKKSFTFRVR
jgi:hypothetical protein